MRRRGDQVTYVHITSTVTSTIVGKRIRPVKVDSLVPPTQKWAEGHGTLGVKVVDRSAVKGVPGIAVTASSTAYTPPVASTDENGCVVFKDVPIGTYTITLNKSGYLDRDAKQLSQMTASVVRKKVVFATMSYDRRRHRSQVDVADSHSRQDLDDATAQRRPSKARKVSTTNGANVGLFTTVTPPAPASSMDAQGLFPFAENSYTFFTGGCRYTSARQGVHARQPELLQRDRWSELRRRRARRSGGPHPACDRPPAAVQHPDRRRRATEPHFLDSDMERLGHTREAVGVLDRLLRRSALPTWRP